MRMNTIKTFPTSEILFQTAAKDFVQRTTQAVKARGICNVVLSGVNTPKSFFACLTHATFASHIPWQHIRFFFGDERYVPANDPASNYHRAQTFLFSKIPVPPENIFRIPTTELAHATAATQHYAQILRDLFYLPEGQFPPFDITYLGLGDNAHTASLMPNTPLVEKYCGAHAQQDKLVASLWVEALAMYPIPLTPPAINHSDAIIFLIEGENKAAAVQKVLEGEKNPLKYPAQLIKNAIWFLDRAAASQLTRSHT